MISVIRVWTLSGWHAAARVVLVERTPDGQPSERRGNRRGACGARGQNALAGAAGCPGGAGRDTCPSAVLLCRCRRGAIAPAGPVSLAECVPTGPFSPGALSAWSAAPILQPHRLSDPTLGPLGHRVVCRYRAAWLCDVRKHILYAA